ncbi:MAG: hypothetical protein JWO94_1841 [Verrucomicrobiaceae bacterium]|nr:hypothetical protein [Verrucomicrobiaceae bacterium]
MVMRKPSEPGLMIPIELNATGRILWPSFMPFLKMFTRHLAVALCLVAYVANMPSVAKGALMAMMQGDHEVSLVACEGHEDLVLCHHKAVQGTNGPLADKTLLHDAEVHESDHVFHLLPNEARGREDRVAASFAAPVMFILYALIPPPAVKSERPASWVSRMIWPPGPLCCLRATVMQV